MTKEQNNTLEFEQSTDFDEPSKDLMRQSDNEFYIQTVDMNQELPDLDSAEVIPFDLNSNYWSPKLAGELKRVIFDAIKVSPVKDFQNPNKIVDLPCAIFFEKINGEIITVRNGSKRLIAILENNNIKRGTPLQIEYMGKKQNKTNGYSGDDWSIRLLNIK